MLTPDLFYEIIVTDRCSERRSEITTALVSRSFIYPTDPTGLNRRPLHVAIDNQSTECFDIFMDVIYKSGPKYRIYLIQKDNRGSTALEHALKNWPRVAFQTLPESTFTHINEEELKNIIKFAMTNNLLANQYFLRSLFLKMPDRNYKIFIMILETFLDLEDCDSRMSRTFFKQIVQHLNPVQFHGHIDQTYFYDLHIRAIHRQCTCFLSNPVVHQFVSDKTFLLFIEAENKPLAFKAISDANVEVLKEASAVDSDSNINAWYADLREYFRKIFPVLESDYDHVARVLSDYKLILAAEMANPVVSPSGLESGLSKEEINTFIGSIDFDYMLKVFFDLNFIPDRKLVKEIEDGTLPPNILLYGCIPSVLLLALHRPDLVPDLNDIIFKESILLAKNANAIDLISCYAPNVLMSQKIDIDTKKESLKYVLSGKCNAPDEMIMESLRILSKSFAKLRVVQKFVGNLTKWTLFSRIFYETNGGDMLQVVNMALYNENFHFAYKAAMTMKVPLNFETMYKFTRGGHIGNCREVIDLMYLVNGAVDLHYAKLFHDKFAIEFRDEADELLLIVLPRLWKIPGFDVNQKVDNDTILPIFKNISLFRIFFMLGKFKVLKALIKLHSTELIISEDDKDYAKSRSLEGSLQQNLSNFAEYNFNKHNKGII